MLDPRQQQLLTTLLRGLLSVGLVLRIVVALLVPNDFGDWRDSQHYLSLARSLVADGTYANEVGRWNGEPLYSDVGPTAFWLPGYPAFLAALLWLLGESPRAIFVTQALFSIVTVLLCYGCATMLWNPPVPLYSAAILSVNPYQLYIPSTISTEPLSTMQLMLIVFAWLMVRAELERAGRPPLWKTLLLGAVLGFGMLTRTHFVVLGIVFIVLLLLVPLSHQTIGPRLRQPVIVTAVVVALLMPWIVRNYVVFGKPIYQTNTGINLFIGYNDKATGKFSLEGVPDYDQASHDEVARNSLYASQAWHWVTMHPWRSVWLFFKKLVMFWNPMPDTLVGIQKWGAFGALLLFLGLAAVGFTISLRSFPRLHVLYLTVAFYCLTHVIAFSITRFRLPLDGVIALFAGAGLAFIFKGQAPVLRPISVRSRP